MDSWEIFVFPALAAGVAIGFLLRRLSEKATIGEAKVQAAQIIANARRDAEDVMARAELAAKESLIKIRSHFDDEMRQRRLELSALEDQLAVKAANLKKQGEHCQLEAEQLKNQEALLKSDVVVCEQKKSQLDQEIHRYRSELERISQLSPAQAAEILKQSMVDQVRAEAGQELSALESSLQKEIEARALRLMGAASVRLALSWASVHLVTKVKIPNEDIKARLIGKEGRNIKTLEALTGVDLVVDQTPGMVFLSSFDPMRREVARLSLLKLIEFGKVHPGIIEQTVAACEKDVEKAAVRSAQEALLELGLGEAHFELMRALGALRWHEAGGQNLLQHSVEVGVLAGLMASELGENVKLARRAGLFHDIGWSLDHRHEGAHAVAGSGFLAQHHEDERVVAAVARHHQDLECQSVLDWLVATANILSSQRPGARSLKFENEELRMKQMEEIALSFQGVEKCFAVHAGHELRVMVSHDRMNDQDAAILSREIAAKIHASELAKVPVKIVVVRETRAVAYS